MVARSFYVYILASRIGGTLYIGVTNDLICRVAEHRLKLAESFTKRYEVARLVYFEQFDDAENAIRREKRSASRGVQCEFLNIQLFADQVGEALHGAPRPLIPGLHP